MSYLQFFDSVWAAWEISPVLDDPRNNPKMSPLPWLATRAAPSAATPAPAAPAAPVLPAPPWGGCGGWVGRRPPRWLSAGHGNRAPPLEGTAKENRWVPRPGGVEPRWWWGLKPCGPQCPKAKTKKRKQQQQEEEQEQEEEEEEEEEKVVKTC